MADLQEIFDECWSIFSKSFPLLDKPNLKISAKRSYWLGKCDGKSKIILNSCLSDCSDNFKRHVIYHEMCHLIYFNHGREFYDLLKKFDPLQEKSNKKLKARIETLKSLKDDNLL